MKQHLAKKDDLKKGTMKNFSAGETEVLLVHTKDGKFYAIEPKCNHYGAPLQNGVLNGERIVCPWHHACFNCKSGKVLEPPALDNLKKYELSMENGNISVVIPEEEKSKTEKFKVEDVKTHPIFVIIGSGAAGNMAARTLRVEGFKGRVIIISEDKHSTYDRPSLSKTFLSGNIDSEDLQLQEKSFFDNRSIELLLDTSVASLDTLTRSIILDSGKSISYDKLLIATGGKPVIPFIPGSELKNIFTLRTYTDSEKIIEKSENSKNCVIIGSSFIAMETASSLLNRNENLNITVVSQDKVPYENVFGKEIGTLIENAHKSNGVKFILEVEATSFKGNGKVETVELSNGKSLNADIVILGIGVQPATDFVKGIITTDDGSIEVDEYLNAAKDIYAAGDIASFPDWRDNKKIRIEHWRTALQQGKVAALNMLGRDVKYKSVPFFWTNQADLKIQYVGHAENWDEIKVDGDIKEKEFLAYYLLDGKVRAVAGSKRNKEMAAIEELMRIDKMPSGERLPKNSEELISMIDSS
jgi:apoptosis-inducing factor 3